MNRARSHGGRKSKTRDTKKIGPPARPDGT